MNFVNKIKMLTQKQKLLLGGGVVLVIITAIVAVKLLQTPETPSAASPASRNKSTFTSESQAPLADPTVQITIPAKDLESAKDLLKATVAVTGEPNIDRVEYFVDDKLVGANKQAPYNLDIDIKTLAAGKHVIKAIIYDKAGKATYDSVATFTIPAAAASGSSSKSAAGGGGSANTGSGSSSSGGESNGGSTTPAGNILGWKLTAGNTGLAPHGLNCDSLALYTGSDKPAAGTVISRKRIEVTLDLSAGNITIEKSCIRPTDSAPGLPLVTSIDFNASSPAPAPSLVTIRDSEISGSKLSAYNAAFTDGFKGLGTIQRNYIHDVGSGIAILVTGMQLSGLIEGNYVTGLRAYGDPSTTGNHSDAFTVRGFSTSANSGRTLTVRNNRLNCNSGNDTGAFFVQTWEDNIGNVTAEGNLLEGDAYQLVLSGGFGNNYSNMKAINNRFSNTGYGASYVADGPGWSQWSENYVNDPSKPDHKGQALSP